MSEQNKVRLVPCVHCGKPRRIDGWCDCSESERNRIAWLQKQTAPHRLQPSVPPINASKPEDMVPARWLAEVQHIVLGLRGEKVAMRELLAGLVKLLPVYDDWDMATCCRAEQGDPHKPDCPWLLASKWLEEHPA